MPVIEFGAFGLVTTDRRGKKTAEANRWVEPDKKEEPNAAAATTRFPLDISASEVTDQSEDDNLARGFDRVKLRNRTTPLIQ